MAGVTDEADANGGAPADAEAPDDGAGEAPPDERVEVAAESEEEPS